MIKVFQMQREQDFSTVSGTGIVLRGVIFPSGAVVVEWCGKSGIKSIGVYKSYEEFEFIHITSHPDNGTTVEVIFEQDV